jgi:hypothetical protein
MFWKASDRGPLARKTTVQRLDRVAADLNVLLMTFAIGLATLDMTCFVSQRLLDRLPEMARIAYLDAPAGASSSRPDTEHAR